MSIYDKGSRGGEKFLFPKNLKGVHYFKTYLLSGYIFTLLSLASFQALINTVISAI